MRIALDAMGGDFAPQTCIEGASLAISEFSEDDHLVLVGQREVIENHLSQQGISAPNIEIVHAEEVIGMHEHPTKAFSQKRIPALELASIYCKQRKWMLSVVRAILEQCQLEPCFR